MAICTICGKKYSKFTTPVSAKRVCSECFFAQLEAEARASDPQPAEETPLGKESQPLPPPGDLQPAEKRPLGKESQPLPPPQPAEPGQSATAMKGAFPLFRMNENPIVTIIGKAFWDIGHAARLCCLGDSSRDEADGSVIRNMNVACHPAAFSGILPSMEPEIDCTLQSNSS